MRWPAHIATPALLILPVHRDGRGVYALYCEDEGRAGLRVARQAQVYVRDQVLATLQARLGSDYEYVPVPDFLVQGEVRGEAVSAVLVSVRGAVSKVQTGSFRNFAQVLRALDKDRDRLIYLKAWQFLAGMAEVKAKATTSTARLE